MRLRLRASVLVASLLLAWGNVSAQNYDRYPDLPFSPVALDWTLDLDAEYGGFEAVASYTFRANRADAFQIVLRHRDLEVVSVQSGATELPFVYAPDAVTVTLTDAPDKGTEFPLTVSYRAYPAYGFFIESDGSVWTSGMPGALDSVLPHMDHPRHQVRTQISIKHDAARQAAANGTFVSRSSPDAGRVTTVFRSRVPLPLNGLRFSIGQYTVSEVKSGNIPVRLYASSLLPADIAANALRSAAVAELEKASAELKAPYPFEALTVVVQPSSYGEAWGDGAGMAWLFADYGALAEQVKLTVAAQWFGQALRGLNTRDRYYLSGYARALAAADGGQLSNEVIDLAGLDLSVDARSAMAQAKSGMSLHETPIADGRLLLGGLPGVIGDRELEEARYLDEMRPRPLALPMNIPQAAATPEEMQTGGFAFRFTRTESPGVLRLEIMPRGTLPAGEYIAELREQYVDTVYLQPIRFEASGGEVDLNVDEGLLNVDMSMGDGHSVEVDKPLGFWLYQIRSAPSRGERVAAAKALGSYSSDPDLRQVIRDLERGENDPAVRGALIVSLAQNGIQVASVTGYKTLLDGPDPALRLAAVQALSYFPSDSAAVAALRSHFAGTNSKEEREAVMASLQAISSPQEQASFIDEYLATGEADAGYLMQALFDEGSIDQGIAMADSLSGAGQPYATRSSALSLLEKFDDSASNWQQRLPRLASDQDPRIRLRAMELVNRLDPQQRDILMRDRQAKEADPRVVSRITPK